MIDITNLSKEELIKLREQVNGRIASLTFQEKKKEDPERYSYRRMPLYFQDLVLLTMVKTEYKDYIKVDYDGKSYLLGDNGRFMIIELWAPKRIRDEILDLYSYHRIYRVFKPGRTMLYKGYVIDGRREIHERLTTE